MAVTIDALQPADWPVVRTIYLAGIATGNATFQSSAPDWESWDAAHLAQPRLAAREGYTLLGWAVLSPVSARPVYAGVSEVSIYIAQEARGRGVGRALLAALNAAADAAGLWTLQAVVFPENSASVALFTHQGYRIVGRRERLGRMSYGPFSGSWRDVLLLERRSPTAGMY